MDGHMRGGLFASSCALCGNPGFGEKRQRTLNIARKYWLHANCLAAGKMRPCPVTAPTPGHGTAPRPFRHRRGTDHLRVAPATSNGTVSTPSHLQPLAAEPRPVHPPTGAGPTTCALHLQRPKVRSRPRRTSNPWPRNRVQTIPSPARDRPLARCTCNVQGYGPDPVASPTPGHGTGPRPFRHWRGTDHLRVAPATSKGTVSIPSHLQPLATEPRPAHPDTGAGPTTCALHLQRPRGRSRPHRTSNPWPWNRAQPIPSPARDRPLARCTCNVQRYGLDPVTPPTPGHGTAPSPFRHRRRTDHLRVTPATSKGTVSIPSHLQPLATEPRPDHSVTGAGPTTCALYLQRPKVRSQPSHI
jgi:hypothetical protein